MNDDAESAPGRALPLDGVLDLHAFRPRDVGDLVPTWIDACAAQGLSELRIVHGKGRGEQRRHVHALLARHPAVVGYRLAPPERGGWGATLVTIRDFAHPRSPDTPRAGAGGEDASGSARAVPAKELAMLEFGTSDGSFTLHARQCLRRPLEELFSFFADPANLAALTPPFLRFELLRQPPGGMGPGARIDYRIKVHGVPITWQARIPVFQPPTCFVDEQLRGPYSFWRHEHRFERVDDDTLLIDRIVYRVPGGSLVNALLVRPDLRRIFAFRHARLAERFGARELTPALRAL